MHLELSAKGAGGLSCPVTVVDCVASEAFFFSLRYLQ